METHKSLTDQIQSLMDYYSFDLANAHIKVKIEPVKLHIIFNLSSITVGFLTAGSSSWTFVEHLILVRPNFHIHSKGQFTIIDHEVESFSCVPVSTCFLEVLRLSTTLHSHCHPDLFQPLVLLQSVCIPPTSYLGTCSCHIQNFMKIFVFLPHPKLIFWKTLLIMDCKLPKARFNLSSL